jgi:DNA-nicking Smr family endonuclease
MSKAKDPSDIDEFRDAVRDVKRLVAPPRAGNDKRKPPPRARFTAQDRAAVLVESLGPADDAAPIDTGDEMAFRRVGVQETALRKLRRGQFRVEAECDLHGLRAEEAKAELRAFLAAAVARGLRCVRVIHGKGLGSGPRGPVLKIAVNLVLRKSAAVLAFAPARRVDGGTGALYVLLATWPGRKAP